MRQHELIDLVERYFDAVDREDFPAVSATLTSDCVFTVETHGVALEGLDEIEGMFRRLWAGHAVVSHRDFVHVAAPDDGRIATRFAVVNSHRDGSSTHKSNCNFFQVRDRRFSHVAVYMAGENTLRSA